MLGLLGGFIWSLFGVSEFRCWCVVIKRSVAGGVSAWFVRFAGLFGVCPEFRSFGVSVYVSIHNRRLEQVVLVGCVQCLLDVSLRRISR